MPIYIDTVIFKGFSPKEKVGNPSIDINTQFIKGYAG